MKKNIILLFLTFHLFSSAQPYFDDAQVWFNLYLEKKISKRFDIHLNQQDRANQNVSKFGLSYADIGITYKFTKNIKLLVDYVFAEKRKNNTGYYARHQFYAALILKKDIRRWRFMYRNMVQFQYDSPFTSRDGYIPYWYDRNKFTIKYEATKRFSFYAAEEVNIPLNNPQVSGLSRSRTFVGTFINTFKHQQLEFYFLYQIQLQRGGWYKQDDSYPYDMLKRDFVYGVGYSIEF